MIAGERLFCVERGSGIRTPAVAAAYVPKRREKPTAVRMWAEQKQNALVTADIVFRPLIQVGKRWYAAAQGL